MNSITPQEFAKQYDFIYIEPKQRCYPCYDKDGNLESPEQPKYKCKNCGLELVHKRYGEYNIYVQRFEPDIFQLIIHHKCKGKNNENNC